MVTIFVSLFWLLTLQTIATILTNEAPATLGMTGHSRTAATAAMLAVILHIAFFLAVSSEFAKPRGLPFLLQ